MQINLKSETMPLCKCGCGEKIKWKRGKYLRGHKNKTLEGRKNLSLAKQKHGTFTKKMSKRPLVADCPTPLCKCGCEEKVLSHRGRWNEYIAHHGGVGKKRSEKLKLEASERMKKNNPMWDRATAVKAHKKALGKKSKVEKKFEDTILEWDLPIQYCASGESILRIENRYPDFRVLGQNKVIEITTKAVFRNGQSVERSLESYALPTINHYEKGSFSCMVIYMVNHRMKLKENLRKILVDFVLMENSYSGVWNYKEFLPFEELREAV